MSNLCRRTLAFATLALTLNVAPIAQAEPPLHTTGYVIGSQQFGLSIGGATNAGAFKGTWYGDPIVFWCVELTQSFGFGNDYTYGPSLPNSDLFSLLGKLFTEAGGSALTSTMHSAAFQLAIWEIVYDSANLELGAGSFMVTDDKGHGATVALAQQWLNGLGGVSDAYDVYLLYNAHHQNFITTHEVTQPPRQEELPEPPALALLAVALAAGWWFARRGKPAVRS
jgi:hypothetical protein